MSRLLLRCCLTAAFPSLALLTVAQPAGAYSWGGGKWYQPGVPGACAGSCIPTAVEITYSFQNMFDGGLRGPGAVPGPDGMYRPDGPPLSNTLIRKSIEEALGVWASHAPLHFIEVPDDGLFYHEGSTIYGEIRFRHIYINGPDPPPPADPIAKARAYFPFGGLNAGDVEYDHGDPWQESGTRPIPDILGATIHELGHSLGLNHSSLSTANMFWIFTRYPGLGTGALHPDDIAGIQYIYGAGTGSVVPLRSVPEPASAALVVVAAAWLLRRRLR